MRIRTGKTSGLAMRSDFLRASLGDNHSQPLVRGAGAGRGMKVKSGVKAGYVVWEESHRGDRG